MLCVPVNEVFILYMANARLFFSCSPGENYYSGAVCNADLSGGDCFPCIYPTERNAESICCDEYVCEAWREFVVS